VSQRERWIPCRVFPGMFSDERTVEVSDQSFFVQVESTRNVQEDGIGEVLVTIVERDGHELAVLPTNMKDSVPLGA